MTIELSPEQQEAKRLIDDFLDARRPSKPWFTLMGLAGTGKTTVLSQIAKARRNAVMCAYSGKAASNLARKTRLPATTIHSCIYRYIGKDTDERGNEELLFMQNVRDGRWTGRIILLDECSTVDPGIGRDLVATGARIVAAGDPGQLPPIRGAQFFAAADFTLTEIRRQALDSPIIRQAHAVRSGLGYRADTDAFRVQRHVERDDIVAADVILCWRNTTRRNLNALKRAHLGLAGPPQPGEPIMCLRNDHEMGVLNGATYEFRGIDRDERYGGLRISLVNERDECVTMRGAWFEDLDETNRRLDDSVGFTWSYAATVHKAQGSEYPFVILVDEYSRQDERARWLYTAVTRASERILVQRDW